MSKYCYGKISNSTKYYVRLKEWHEITDCKGDLLQTCRVIKTFDRLDEVIKFIDYLKECDRDNLSVEY